MTLKSVSYILAAICLCISQFDAFGQHFNFQPLSVQDGLAQSQVYALLEDSRGYIWMGTRGGGISRYDGQNFVNLTTSDGLIDNYIQSLYEDSQGQIWIGTTRGLSRYDGLSFSNYTPLAGIETSIESIIQDSTGTMWFGTDSGLFCMKNDSLHHFSTDQPWEFDAVYDLALDDTGKIWGGTDHGLLQASDYQAFTTTESGGLPSNLINAIEFDDQGRLWVAVYGQGVFIRNNDSFERVRDVESSVVFSMTQVGNSMWLGTLDEGIFEVDLRSLAVSKHDVDSGLPNNQVRALEGDEWGNVWIGTSGSGAAVYSGQQIQFFNRDNGLPGRRVYSVAEDAVGVMWMGIDNDKIILMHPDSNNLFYREIRDLGGKVKCLQLDELGRMWCGTEGGGLHVIGADSTLTFDYTTGLVSNYIKSILHRGSTTYIATTDGISVLNRSASDPWDFDSDLINRKDGLSENRVTDLAIDHLGRLWFSTLGSGIGLMLNDKTIVNFDKEVGLTANSVRSLEIDDLGWLWIGTAGGGISCMNLLADTLSIEPFSEDVELLSDNIYFLQLDADHNLWVGTEGGVEKVSFNQERQPIEVQKFRKEEGFLGIETCTNASFIDSECNLWFGTIDGLAMTDPTMRFSNDHPPKTHVTGVNLFYENLMDTHLRTFVSDWGQINDTLVLTYEQNHLGFEFIGIDHIAPQKVRYQWQLLGAEDTWSPLTEQRSTSYSNLEPGDYIFQVRAVNSEGIMQEEPQEIRFVILAPFWQKTWFLVAAIALGILALVFVFYLRIQTVKRIERERSTRLLLEKGMVELEQKALRLQMNPHFIFNTLNTIQGLIATRDAKTARLYLSKFSKLMRETLENSREALISVDEETSALRHYLDLEKFSHEEVFEYDIQIGEGSDQYMIPPLLIQPFCENAIIHGLIPKGGNGRLIIAFTETKQGLEITIEDNGVGRAKASENKSQKINYHKSTGLQVTQERLDMLNQNGGRSIVFEDLADSEGHAAGTRVTLKVTLDGA